MGRRNQLYKNLINSKAVTEYALGTENEFISAMSSPEKAGKIYDNLINKTKLTAENIGTREQFIDFIAPDFGNTGNKGKQDNIFSEEYLEQVAEPSIETTSDKTKNLMYDNPFSKYTNGIKGLIKPEQPSLGSYEEIKETGDMLHSYEAFRQGVDNETNRIQNEIKKGLELPEVRVAAESKNPYAVAAAFSQNYGKAYYRYRKQDIDAYKNYSTANNLITEAKKTANASKNKSGFWKGVGDNLLTEDAVTLGLSTFRNTQQLKSLLDKVEKEGIQSLTPSENTLLEAASVKSLSDMIYESGLSKLYNVGSATGTSIPYMLQFVITHAPASAIAKPVMKKLTGYVTKRFGEAAIKKAAARAISTLPKVGTKTALKTANALVKTGAAALEAGATGALMPIIQPSTYNDILERKMGQVDADINPQTGNVQYKGQTGGKSWGRSIGEALTAQSIDNLAEMSGGAIIKALGLPIKAISKVSPKSREFVNMISEKPLLRSFNRVREDIAKTTGVHSIPGEALEEFVGQTANALTVGDQKLEDVYTWENAWMTLASVAPLSIGMGSASGVMAQAAKKKVVRDYNRASQKLSEAYSPDLVEYIKSRVGGSPEQQAMIIRQYYDRAREAKNEEEKRNIANEYRLVMDYAAAVNNYDAYIGGIEARVANEVSALSEQIRNDINPDMNATVYIDYDGQMARVTSGNIVFDENGDINDSKSDDTITIELQDGTKQMVSPDKFKVTGYRSFDDQINEATQNIENTILSQEDTDVYGPDPVLDEALYINTDNGPVSVKVTRADYGGFEGIQIDESGNEITEIVDGIETPVSIPFSKDQIIRPDNPTIETENSTTVGDARQLQAGDVIHVTGFQNPVTFVSENNEDAIVGLLDNNGNPIINTEGKQVQVPVKSEQIIRPTTYQPLSERQASQIISDMEQNAVPEPKLALTPENWISQFGEDGIIDTPIGKVKMGENQYFKLAQKGRSGKLGMIKPTLEDPDVIIEDNSKVQNEQTEERPSSIIFIKTFTGKDGSRLYYFTSVTVRKDGNEVVVSNQEKNYNRISGLLQNGKVLRIKPYGSLHPTTQEGKSVSQRDSRELTSTDNQPANLGISSPTVSVSENTKLKEENQDIKKENTYTALSRIPTDENGNPIYEQAETPDLAWDAIVEQTDGDEEMAQTVADSMVADKEASLKKLEKTKSKNGVTVTEKIAAEKERKESIEKAKQELQWWKEIAETAKRRNDATREQIEDGNGTAGRTKGTERFQDDNRGRTNEHHAEQQNDLAQVGEQVELLVSQMRDKAETARGLELTPENWDAEFGEDGMVETPVGKVKMGENQYLKLLKKKRDSYFGMIKPTLTNPDIVLEEYDPKDGAERATKYLFVKTFIKSDGSRYVHFESVTVQKDNLEVSISSHEINKEALMKKVHQDKLIHLNNKLFSSDRRLTEPQKEGSDLVPTPSSVSFSNNKDTTFSRKNNELDKKVEKQENTRPKLEEKKNLQILSEEEFIEQNLDNAYDNRVDKALTREDWEDSDEYIQNYNNASDSYPDYINNLRNSGELQSLYDNGNIGQRIKIREAVETAGFNVNEYIDTSKEKAEYKKKRDEKRRIQQIERMKRIGLIDKNNENNVDDIRFRTKENNDITSFAIRHNLIEKDVQDYADYMRQGNLNGASGAFTDIRRKVRIDNKGVSLGEFIKIFSPIRQELYEKFGNVDELREQYVQTEMEKRDMMDAARKRAEDAAEAERKRLQEFQGMSDEQLDEEYFKAIDTNDESRMRDLVNEAARRNGYGDVGSEYQGVGAWSAPSNPGYESDEERRAAVENESPDVNVTDIANGYLQQPDDYFTNLRAYGNNNPHGRESADAINKAMDDVRKGKDPKIKVYRAVPKTVKEGTLRNGDWVTPSRKYAEMHGNNRLEGDYRIIEQEVSASQLWWDGNDINEWGFDDGKRYAYRNTRNNRKLNDLITRDDKGNVIPLSKRFNSRKEDTRFRFIGEEGAANLDRSEEATTRLDNLNVAREMENAFEEKKARIEKLRNSEPVEITGNEITPSEDLKQYKKNALEYGKKLQGEYTNKDTGRTIQLQRGRKNGGIKEVLSHDTLNDTAQIKSIAAIPSIIENAIYIDSSENQDTHKNPNVVSYHYYICGLKIGGEDYTVRMVEAEEKDGSRYYDHRLTHIEKGKLINELALINSSSSTELSSTPDAEAEDRNRPTNRGEIQTAPISNIKDTRLISLLQTNDQENARKIKLATGWERGADGKWRYETNDIQTKDNVFKLLSKVGKEYPLKDFLTNQSYNVLISEYPQLSDVVVSSTDFGGDYGSAHWDRNWKAIRFNKQYIDHVKIQEIIAHEIQHAIQDIEGFALGTSPSAFINSDSLYKYSPSFLHDAFSVRRYAEDLIRDGKYKKMAWAINHIIPIYYQNGFFRNKEMNEKDLNDLYFLANNYTSKELNDVSVNQKEFDKLKEISINKYIKTSGEVEARNVSRRMNMTMDERRKSLASETEDVAREDQIFLYDNMINNPQAIESQIPKEEKINEIKRLSDILNTEVEIYDTQADLPTNIREKANGEISGYYMPGNDKVAIVLDANISIGDIQATMLHEIVGHKGIRGLFGNRTDEFLDKVFESMDANVRAEYMERFNSERLAAEEYLSELAEYNPETSGIKKIIAIIRDFFREILGIDLKLSDNDIVYILSKSRERLQNSRNLSENKPLNESYSPNEESNLTETNRIFNDRLSELTEQNSDNIVLDLGNPSEILLSAGIEDKPMKLYGNKVIKKMKKHGFKLEELRNLPEAVANPIAVFEGSVPNSHAILTELKTNGKNILATISIGKGSDIDFNIITSAYGKDGGNIQKWINEGKGLYFNKEKALDYLRIPAPIAGAQDSQGLFDIANIVKEFENPTIPNKNEAVEKRIQQETEETLYRLKSPVKVDVSGDSAIEAAEKISGAQYLQRVIDKDIYRNISYNTLNRNAIQAVGYGRKKLRYFDKRKMENAYKGLFDNMNDLHNLQKTIIDTYGSIDDSLNAYYAENASSSRAQDRTNRFQVEYEQPLINTLAKIRKKFNNDDFMMKYYPSVRTIIERQRVVRERKIKEAQNDPKIKDDRQSLFAAIQLAEKKDYAGQTGTYKEILAHEYPEFKFPANFETMTYDEVKDFAKENNLISMEDFVERSENILGNDLVNEFWDNIRKISQYKLYNDYQTGMISRTTFEELNYGVTMKELAKKRLDDGEIKQEQYDFVLNTFNRPEALLSRGIITKNQYNSLKPRYEYYLPLKGTSDVEADDINEYNNKKVKNISALKAVEGHENVARDPLPQLLQDVYGSIMSQEQNRWRNTLLNMLRKYPMPDLYHIQTEYFTPIRNDKGNIIEYVPYVKIVNDKLIFVPTDEELKAKTAIRKRKGLDLDIEINKRQSSEHAVTFLENGDYVTVYFTDPRIAQSINNLNVNTLPTFLDSIMKWGGKINRFRSQFMTTANPEFVIANVIKDFQEANSNILIKEGLKYWKEFNKIYFNPELGAAIRRRLNGKKGDTEIDKYVDEFFKYGGETAYNMLPGYEQKRKDLYKEIKKVNKEGNKAILVGSKVKDWAKDNLEMLNKQAELRARIATYVTSRKHTKREISRSIWDAKEITVNFDKKGSWAKGFGFWQLFWNAGRQSNRMQIQMIKTHPIKWAIVKSVNTAIGFAETVLPWLILDDDDRKNYLDKYFSITPYLRYSNLIMGFGGELVTIPLPPAFIPSHTLGVCMAEMVLKNNEPGFDPTALVIDVANAGANEWLPEFIVDPVFDIANRKDFVISSIVPAQLKPFAEIYDNRNFFGSPIYNDNINEFKPAYQRIYNGTGPTYVNISQTLNNWTGGNEVDRGFIQLNPAILEHLVEGYVSGLGKFGEKAFTTLSGNAESSKDIPVLGRFWRGDIEYYLDRDEKNTYYRLLKQAEEYRYRRNEYRKLNGYESEKEELKKEGELYEPILIQIRKLNRYKRLEKNTSDPKKKEKYKNKQNEVYKKVQQIEEEYNNKKFNQ